MLQLAVMISHPLHHQRDTDDAGDDGYDYGHASPSSPVLPNVTFAIHEDATMRTVMMMVMMATMTAMPLLMMMMMTSHP